MSTAGRTRVRDRRGLILVAGSRQAEQKMQSRQAGNWNVSEGEARKES